MGDAGVVCGVVAVRGAGAMHGIVAVREAVAVRGAVATPPAANQSAVSAPAGTLARALLPGAGAHAGRLLRAESTTAM